MAASLLLVAVSALILVAMSQSTSPLAGWDAKADWLTAKAALEGMNPYLTVKTLGERLGVPVADFPGIDPSPHPRLPGAILLQLPLASFSPDSAVLIAQGAVVLAVGGMLIGTVWESEASAFFSGAVALLVLLSFPFLSAVFFGNQSGVVAGLVLLALLSARHQQQIPTGVFLALAATLKVFPAVALLPLWRQGKLRPVVAFLVTVVGLNLLGLAVVGGSPGQIVKAMGEVTRAWIGGPGSTSVAGLLVASGIPLGSALLVTASAGALVLMKVSAWRHYPIGGAISVAPLFLPISWIHYQLVTVAVLIAAPMPPRKRTLALGLCAGGWGLLPALLFVVETDPRLMQIPQLALCLAPVFLLWRLVEARPADDGNQDREPAS